MLRADFGSMALEAKRSINAKNSTINMVIMKSRNPGPLSAVDGVAMVKACRCCPWYRILMRIDKYRQLDKDNMTLKEWSRGRGGIEEN